MKKINIAIDGHSSCGKGTLAKFLAKELNYIFIDTGAMYRAVTWALLMHENIDFNDLDAIKTNLNSNLYNFKSNSNKQEFNVFYDGLDISAAIRKPAVSNYVSQVRAVKEVRNFLVNLQQEMAKNGGVVMDGRDICTHVLPNAELKIFMTANPKIRAKRRYQELKKNGVDVDFEQVYENIIFRDQHDSTREINPLIKALDALELDNSNLSKEEQNAIALNWANEIISKA